MCAPFSELPSNISTMRRNEYSEDVFGKSINVNRLNVMAKYSLEIAIISLLKLFLEQSDRLVFAMWRENLSCKQMYGMDHV